ncbi:hypothetical protein [Burkholderia sp. SCN-KJ]|uniref:hypothetical protein n=1 Tax=Burkholderia sp. SCN-KJ TaxID=2969248 RepID=UPI0021503613|nr:hypothetical protein [Burkholderia sp. SCN-KJ]MCR4465298.1 hypothetical protein [Burkholderia sp. SCN-KJ]
MTGRTETAAVRKTGAPGRQEATGTPGDTQPARAFKSGEKVDMAGMNHLTQREYQYPKFGCEAQNIGTLHENYYVHR